jgi:hypothetical protein
MVTAHARDILPWEPYWPTNKILYCVQVTDRPVLSRISSTVRLRPTWRADARVGIGDAVRVRRHRRSSCSISGNFTCAHGCVALILAGNIAPHFAPFARTSSPAQCCVRRSWRWTPFRPNFISRNANRHASDRTIRYSGAHLRAMWPAHTRPHRAHDA